METAESLNALLSQFLLAITKVDCPALSALTTHEFHIEVPGPSFIDITENVVGSEALCRWANRVHDECGTLTFDLHRYFESDSEIMASGDLVICRSKRKFRSPSAIYVRIEAGKIASFQLLFDTFALQKFRGHLSQGYQ